MSSQPAPTDDNSHEIRVTLPYGLVALYTLKAEPKPPPEPEPWTEGDPPPWGSVGFPAGYEEPLPW